MAGRQGLQVESTRKVKGFRLLNSSDINPLSSRPTWAPATSISHLDHCNHLPSHLPVFGFASSYYPSIYSRELSKNMIKTLKALHWFPHLSPVIHYHLCSSPEHHLPLLNRSYSRLSRTRLRPSVFFPALSKQFSLSILSALLTPTHHFCLS